MSVSASPSTTGLGTLPPADTDSRLETASQWQLMRWRFLRHRAAVVSMVVVSLFYLMALLVEFVAPYDPSEPNVLYQLAPPQRLRFGP